MPIELSDDQLHHCMPNLSPEKRALYPSKSVWLVIVRQVLWDRLELPQSTV